jgi:hypothetical protein
MEKFQYDALIMSGEDAWRRAKGGRRSYGTRSMMMVVEGKKESGDSKIESTS